jgi:hypothetical protein
VGRRHYTAAMRTRHSIGAGCCLASSARPPAMAVDECFDAALDLVPYLAHALEQLRLRLSDCRHRQPSRRAPMTGCLPASKPTSTAVLAKLRPVHAFVMPPSSGHPTFGNACERRHS